MGFGRESCLPSGGKRSIPALAVPPSVHVNVATLFDYQTSLRYLAGLHGSSTFQWLTNREWQLGRYPPRSNDTTDTEAFGARDIQVIGLPVDQCSVVISLL
ncbi:hypothetical protein CHU98_g10081 [Xylaria longipes]|nr:hypothetical protein CHU98_g10081 [Xylaria longipes]